jgi:uncharacterized tellurite resistance protein B-like protein
MWKKLLSRIAAPPPADGDARQRTAVAVLLLECARADFQRSEAEMAVVREALRGYLGVDGAELDRLLAEAGEQAHRSVSLHDFVRHLNQSMQPSDKRALFAMLWRVAYADGRLDPDEEQMLRRLADMLYVPHQDYIATKLQVQGV